MDANDSAEVRKLRSIEEATSVISGLSAQQRRWLVRYLFHGNATKAAEEVGYAHPNKQGPRLRHKPKIQSAIDEYFHQQEMSAAEAVAILSNQARSSMGDFIHLPRNEEGEPIRALDPEIDLYKAEQLGKLQVLKKFKVKKKRYVGKNDELVEDWYAEIELYDAQAAAVQIGRYHGVFKDKTDITSDGEQIQQITIIREERE